MPRPLIWSTSFRNRKKVGEKPSEVTWLLVASTAVSVAFQKEAILLTVKHFKPEATLVPRGQTFDVEKRDLSLTVTPGICFTSTR